MINLPLTVLNLLDTVSTRTEKRCLLAARPRLRDANVSCSDSGSDMVKRCTFPGPGVQIMSTPSWNSTTASSNLSAHDQPGTIDNVSYGRVNTKAPLSTVQIFWAIRMIILQYVLRQVPQHSFRYIYLALANPTGTYYYDNIFFIFFLPIIYFTRFGQGDRNANLTRGPTKSILRIRDTAKRFYLFYGFNSGI